jgi:radical SAM superfamily enzyme YgiQ (UPF0313 family)
MFIKGNNCKITNWASWFEYRELERQTIKLPAGGDMPCAIFFPADYSVGMANLGLHYIYRTLRETGVAVERFFAAPIPYRSVERDTLLERFPLILASVSYEADIPLFARWLGGGGVEPVREHRETSSSGNAPLIGAGGAVTYINPISLSGICDFIVLGDGVETTRGLVEILRQGLPREKMLAALADHPSIYVPSIHERGRHLLEIAKTDITRDYGRGVWITERTVFGDTLLLELQRGCVRGCGFCTLPSCFAPARSRGLELVKRDIEEASGAADFSRIGLVTPEAGDYKALDELIEFASSIGKQVSFASLRVDGITERMMKAVIDGGRHSVTIAPEAGDENLRSKTGKRFTNKRVVDVLKMASDLGAKSAKMYFMFGLPGETDEHLLEISKLCATARDETGLKITAAASPFVPKPGTAWREEVFEGEKNLKRKHAIISRSFGGLSGVKLQTAGIREACIEYAVSWAGASASRLIAEAALSGASYKRLVNMTDRSKTCFEFERLGLNAGTTRKGAP